MPTVTGEVHAVEVRTVDGLITNGINQQVRGDINAVIDMATEIIDAIKDVEQVLPPDDGMREYDVSITNGVIRVSGHHRSEQ